MGFGLCSVSGRSRVPLPPASRIALIAASDHIAFCFKMNPGRQVNLPNSLTVARIFLVPLLVLVLLTKFNDWAPFELLAAAIFGLASLTDWADGYLARRRNQVTGFGQWMDPLA